MRLNSPVHICPSIPPDSFHYCSGDHLWHSEKLTGKVIGGPTLKRTTPSEVEQKLLDPVLLLTGVPTTTYSSQVCFLQTAVMLN